MYLSLNELVEEIQMNIERLQNGQMDLDEVEKHVTLVRELYERTVVLKFKALELKSTVVIDVKQKEETVIMTETPTIVEQELSEDKEVIEQVVNTSEKEDNEEVEFDLFGSMFTNEVVKEDVNEIVKTETVVIEAESHIQNEVETQIDAIEKESELEEIEIPVDLSAFEVKEEVSQSVVAARAESLIEPTIVAEVKEQVVDVQVLEPVTDVAVPKHLVVFSEKLKEVNAGASNQFGFSPLNTLIGSFGLNERLQYINELFGASSEAFSDAVKAFDALQNLQQANDLILEYANAQMWDVESPAVEEFMHKLCRRYA